MRNRISLLLLCTTLSAYTAEVDFVKEILPVIKDKCYSCHRTPHEVDGKLKKPKGGLILDTPEGILKGGSEGISVVPGDTAKSYIVEVIALPPSDDMAMPPEGKGDPLTPEQIELMKKWITEGAKFGDWKGDKPEAMAAEGTSASTDNSKPSSPDIYAALAQGLAPAADASVQAVTAAGGRALPIAQDNPLLRVDYLMTRKETDDTKIASLSQLKDNVTQLELGETQITDAGLAPIAELKKLTRLDLHKTKIGDAGLKNLSGLENLVYLNLYGTEVTDAGLEALAPLKNLKSLYLWQSKVTENGVKALKEKLPGTNIIWQ